MQHLQNSDREERNAIAGALRSKMATELADQWQQGNCELVKATIDCALDAGMRNQWKDDTAEALPPMLRQGFLDYMRE